MPSLRRALLLLIGSIAGTLVPAIAVHAQDGAAISIQLVEAPADRAGDPRASQYIIDHVAPGDRVTRRFSVASSLATPTTVSLYDAAAEVDAGGFRFGDGRAENDLTSWTEVSPESAEVPPGGSVRGTIEIEVPDDAAGGERYGVVWAELPGAAMDNGVTVVNRVGIRIYLSVGGDREPPTEFRLETFQPVRLEDGRPAIDVRACNEGGRAVDLEGELNLEEGPGGTSAGPFESGSARTLAPGDCGGLTIPVPQDLPLGPWRAHAALRSGTAEEAAEATVTFPPPGTAAGPAVDVERVTDTPGGRLAIAVAAALLVLLLALLGYRAWRHRAGSR